MIGLREEMRGTEREKERERERERETVAPPNIIHSQTDCFYGACDPWKGSSHDSNSRRSVKYILLSDTTGVSLFFTHGEIGNS